MVSYHILLTRGEKTIVGGVVRSKERLSQSNPPHTNTSNFNLGQPCFHYNTYGHDVEQSFTFHLKLQQGQFHTSNANKRKGSWEEGQKGNQ
jgi:hypothetical protein